MIGSPNTCSRCRFFSRNACSTRHCHDWTADRARKGKEADWDEEERDDPSYDSDPEA